MARKKKRKRPRPDDGVVGTIYLICFALPVCDGRPARHYLGWTSRAVDERFNDHATGQGAKITAAAAARKIEMTVTRTWAGTRNFERKLKNQKNTPRLCPGCSGTVFVTE